MSGYYFAHFQLTSGPNAGRVTTTWFIVREAAGAGKAPILVQASPTTWQAYNGWGGGSLYEFNSPNGRRAAKVAFDRPYQQPFEQRPESLEVPLVRFLEQNGYDVAYQADVDTARNPGSVVGRRSSRSPGTASTGLKACVTASTRHAAPESTWPSSARMPPTGRSATRTTSARSSATRARPGTQSPIGARHLSLPRAGASPARMRPHGDPACGWHARLDHGWRLRGDRRSGDRSLAPARGLRARRDGAGSREPRGRRDPRRSVGGELLREPPHCPLPPRAGHRRMGRCRCRSSNRPSGAKVFASGSHQFVWGLADVPEVERMRHGIVDSSCRPSYARCSTTCSERVSGLAARPGRLGRGVLRRGGVLRRRRVHGRCRSRVRRGRDLRLRPRERDEHRVPVDPAHPDAIEILIGREIDAKPVRALRMRTRTSPDAAPCVRAAFPAAQLSNHACPSEMYSPSRSRMLPAPAANPSGGTAQ